MSEGPSPDEQARAASEAQDARACPSCGAPLQPDQDWCLQCGAGRASGRSGPGWRSAAAALGGAAVLALGAAAAAYAAFKAGPPASAPPVSTAQTPPATATPPPTTTTPPPSTATSTTASAPPTGTPEGLPAARNPPEIPLSSGTPTGGESSTPPSSGGGTGNSGTGEAGGGSEQGNGGGQRTTVEEKTCSSLSAERERAEEEAEEATTQTTSETSSTQTSSAATGAPEGEGEETQAKAREAAEETAEEAEARAEAEGCESTRPKTAPILLRRRDVSSYDPNGFPEAGYLKPALAIDGDASTAWTAATAPTRAPKVQAGLLIDLGHKRKIAKLALISRSLGMTLRIYGTTDSRAPKSIESKRWIELSGVHRVEQRSSTIKLKRTPEIRQLLVWVLRAPEIEPLTEGEAVEESAAINEVALYEPK